jgi:hypothetical protein
MFIWKQKGRAISDPAWNLLKLLVVEIMLSSVTGVYRKLNSCNLDDPSVPVGKRGILGPGLVARLSLKRFSPDHFLDDRPGYNGATKDYVPIAVLITFDAFVKMAAIFSPKVLTPAIIATAISANSKPYSTPLAPDSSLKSFLILSMSPLSSSCNLVKRFSSNYFDLFVKMALIFPRQSAYCTHNCRSDQRY